MTRKIVLFFSIFLLTLTAKTQSPYSIDLSHVKMDVIHDQFKMGNSGPTGKEIKVNSRFVSRGGKPIIPIMGEFHFSRYPRQLWKDVLLKMKANGITVVATYVIWIHHEEIEGQFEWSSHRDLRHFVKLCDELDLLVYPRIGPWCHGEIRNGGFPDWLLKKQFLHARKNDPVYFSYVDKWFTQIGNQLQGLMYKDGGPIIGIQLENEYRRGKGGESHIVWLKKKAQEVGLDVPLYTVTGWGNASVPPKEVIPLFGGYPSAPWTTHTKKLEPYSHFFYEPVKTSTTIGNDGDQGELDTLKQIVYPNFTCEVGVGNQISYHRRPCINSIDGAAIIQAKIGSGSNLPGYYVFAGGLNPIGIYSTMEENRDETSYYNDYPDISYDFQAAIGEFGQLAPSYHEVKKIHYWLNDFQESIAPMVSVFPESNKDQESLQYAVRTDGASGYIFASNYQRLYPRATRKNVQFNITLAGETLAFPSKPIHVQDSTFFIWPFNLDIGEATLKYATAQLLCNIEDETHSTWFFFQNNTIESEFLFGADNIKTITTSNGKVSQTKNEYLITNLIPGKQCKIELTLKSGAKKTLVLLSYEEAKQSWKLNFKGKERLFISSANLYVDNDALYAFSKQNKIDIWAFPSLKKSSDSSLNQNNHDALFQHTTLEQKKITPQVHAQKADIFRGAKWLKVKPDELSPKQQLYHKQFIKEIHLLNPARIKSAQIVYVSGSPFQVNINNRWVNHNFKTKEMEAVDITGYLKKGGNSIFIDFILGKADGSFIGYLEVEYFSSDRICIPTDQSWVENSGYLIPSALSMPTKTKSPSTMKDPGFEYISLENNRWDIQLPFDVDKSLSNILLKVDYKGNMAQLRLGHQLLTDHYYYGEPWEIGLKTYNTGLEGKVLSMQITPLLEDEDVYFDQPIPFTEGSLLQFNDVQIIPEYQFKIP